jgi:cysteine-rich repeat protein
MCGDGVTDEDGEQCDDGNAVPNDACTNGCLDLFADDDAFIEYDGTCIGLLAAQFSSGDESIDLALVIDSDTVIPVLENDGEGVFSDMNHSFATGNSVVNVAVFPATIDGDEGGKDIVALHSIVSVCINKSDEATARMAIEYRDPAGFRSRRAAVLRPKFLQVGDISTSMTDNDALRRRRRRRTPMATLLGVIPRGKTGTFALTKPSVQARQHLPRRSRSGATSAIAVGPFSGQGETARPRPVGYEDNGAAT